MSIRLKAACILAFAPPCLYGIAQLYSRSPEPGTVVVSGLVSLPPELVAIDAGVSAPPLLRLLMVAVKLLGRSFMRPAAA